jgi:hypothetical protein
MSRGRNCKEPDRRGESSGIDQMKSAPGVGPEAPGPTCWRQAEPCTTYFDLSCRFKCF